MLNHRPDVIFMGVFLMVAGVVVAASARALVRVVGDRSRAMYGKRGAAFANKLRPLSYWLAGGVSFIVGCLLLLLGLLAR
jgi:hypothetical protein